mgnify:CR=1 FL=1
MCESSNIEDQASVIQNVLEFFIRNPRGLDWACEFSLVRRSQFSAGPTNVGIVLVWETTNPAAILIGSRMALHYGGMLYMHTTLAILAILTHLLTYYLHTYLLTYHTYHTILTYLWAHM